MLFLFVFAAGAGPRPANLDLRAQKAMLREKLATSGTLTHFSATWIARKTSISSGSAK
jgi:hypothetical protein